MPYHDEVYVGLICLILIAKGRDELTHRLGELVTAMSISWAHVINALCWLYIENCNAQFSYTYYVYDCLMVYEGRKIAFAVS